MKLLMHKMVVVKQLHSAIIYQLELLNGQYLRPLPSQISSFILTEVGGLGEEVLIYGGAHYVSLQKYFSHPSLVMYSFATPPIKLKLGD